MESLANELLLEVFQYLTTCHIYHAFHGLNSHFDGIILEYFRTCDVDLRSISKRDFDLICEHYLTQTTDRVQSLCLSDDDDTPGQIDRFLARGLTLHQFSNVQSLCLSSIRSEELLQTLMSGFPSLINLTDLTFEQCAVPSKHDETSTFANTIWSLPKLVRCCFRAKYKHRQSHHFLEKYRRDQGVSLRPTVTSLTLQHLLCIGLQPCDVVLDQVLAHTPHLRRLVVDQTSDFVSTQTTPLLSLTDFTVSAPFHHHGYMFLNTPQRMSNLSRLKLDMPYAYWCANGYRWQELVFRHLRNLQHLQFRTTATANNWETEEDQTHDMLSSFRTNFWLERRWFVRCDWFHGKQLLLYTLPYAFDDYQVLTPITSASTCPADALQCTYDHVHTLMYKPRVSDMSFPADLRFNRIHHLSIALPVSEQFHALVPTLAHLTTLDVLSEDHDEQCQQQLQDLLDRAPCLSSIRLCWKRLTSPLQQLFDCRNLSVYHLELLGHGEPFDRQQCTTLSSLIPGIDCQVLNLTVADRLCILDLVHTLKHLSALNIHFRHRKFVRSSPSAKDALCEWLRAELAPTFPDVHISRQNDTIRLWIGER